GVAQVVAGARVAEIAPAREGLRRVDAIAGIPVVAVIEGEADLVTGLGLAHEAGALVVEAVGEGRRGVDVLGVRALPEPLRRDRARGGHTAVAGPDEDVERPPRVARHAPPVEQHAAGEAAGPG